MGINETGDNNAETGSCKGDGAGPCSDLGAQERTPAPEMCIRARSRRRAAARIPATIAVAFRCTGSAQTLHGRSSTRRAVRRFLPTETRRDRAVRRVTRLRHRDLVRKGETTTEDGHVRSMRTRGKSLPRRSAVRCCMTVQIRNRRGRARARARRRTDGVLTDRDDVARRARMTSGRDDRGKRRSAPVSTAGEGRVGRRRERTVTFSPCCYPARVPAAKSQPSHWIWFKVYCGRTLYLPSG